MRLINSDGQIVDARVMSDEGSNSNRNESSVRLEAGWYVIPLCVVSLVISAAALIYTYNVDRVAREAKTQAWLSERRMLDIQAYAILNGWALPSDAENGPLGNLERMKRKEK